MRLLRTRDELPLELYLLLIGMIALIAGVADWLYGDCSPENAPETELTVFVRHGLPPTDLAAVSDVQLVHRMAIEYEVEHDGERFTERYVPIVAGDRALDAALARGVLPDVPVFAHVFGPASDLAVESLDRFVGHADLGVPGDEGEARVFPGRALRRMPTLRPCDARCGPTRPWLPFAGLGLLVAAAGAAAVKRKLGISTDYEDLGRQR